MCSTTHNADPRAALAEYIRHKTDNGNQVVDYLHDVLHERLDRVKHGHRTSAAHILTEYGDLAAIRFLEKEKEEVWRTQDIVEFDPGDDSPGVAGGRACERCDRLQAQPGLSPGDGIPGDVNWFKLTGLEQGR